MSEPTPLLDREGIEEAFRWLGDRLAKRGVVADIYVFSGAAMALAYDSRRATRDVDALFKPHGIVLEEAQAVAAELGLPNWWPGCGAQVLPVAGSVPESVVNASSLVFQGWADDLDWTLAVREYVPAGQETWSDSPRGCR